MTAKTYAFTIAKDDRNPSKLGNENLPKDEYSVVAAGYSAKTAQGYSWLHVVGKEDPNTVFMVGGITLKKLVDLGLVDDLGDDFGVPNTIKFGVKDWEPYKIS